MDAPPLRLWLLSGLPGGEPGVMAWSLDDLGFATWAQTREEVLARAPAKYAEHRAWLAGHGLGGPAAPDVDVVEERGGDELLFTQDRDSPVTPAAVGRFVIEVMAVSVLMTWLFVNTAGSLWIAVAFHAAWNADAHRFFFKPLDDEGAAGVSRLAAAVMVAAAVVVAAWPGAL